MSLAARVVAAFDALVRLWLRAPRSLRWVAVLMVIGSLWWSSSRQPSPSPPSTLRAVLHNAMHLVAYAALAFVSWAAVRRADERRPQLRALVTAFAITASHGVVDELHQAFVPGRACTISDVVTDVCGAATMLWCVAVRVDGLPWRAAHAIVLLAACAGSVALATFGPW